MNLLDKKIEWLSALYPTDKLRKLSEDQLCLLYDRSQPKKVHISSLEKVPTSGYRISSPDGYVNAHSWRNKGNKECVTVSTDAGSSITASIDHFFELFNGKWKYASTLLVGDCISTESGSEVVTSIEAAGQRTVYDFHIDHENHRYYTNGLSSHNSGAGKSLFLANLGVNWALQGMNVLYLTLELSENLVSMRVDSMTTGIGTRDIFKNIDDVEMKVKMIGKKAGAFQVKYMPSGKTPNDIRAYVKEYEIKSGKKVDVLLIDYLDLLMPNGAKISAENLFIKDKYVSEELRNLAMELNTVFVTAAQLNRGAVEEIEFDHSHISGGLSKIQTADNVFGIFTSRAMRERGRYQIQLMKTRSSSGVGAKIDLGFNVDSLRIVDIDEDEDDPSQAASGGQGSGAIVNALKRTSNSQETTRSDPSEGKNIGKVRAETESTQLRQFINNIGNGDDDD
jgi:hypothetical protein